MKKVIKNTLLATLALGLVAQNAHLSAYWPFSGGASAPTEQAQPAPSTGYSRWLTRGVPAAAVLAGSAAAAYQYNVKPEDIMAIAGQALSAMGNQAEQTFQSMTTAQKMLALNLGTVTTILAVKALSPSQIAEMKKTMPAPLDSKTVEMLLSLPAPLTGSGQQMPSATQALDAAGSPEDFIPPVLRKKYGK